MTDPFKEINPFNDVPNASPEGEDNYGSQHLNDIRSMRIGTGDEVFSGNKDGIWLGAKEFADAPFRVDMAGNVTANSIAITGGSITGTTITLGGSNNEDGILMIKDASGDTILQADKDGYHGYDGDGVELVRMDATDGLGIYGDDGATVNFRATAAGDVLASMGYDSSGDPGLSINSDGFLLLFAQEQIYLSSETLFGLTVATTLYADEGVDGIGVRLVSINCDIVLEPAGVGTRVAVKGDMRFIDSAADIQAGIDSEDGTITTLGKMQAVGGYDPIVEVDDELYSTWAPEAPQYLVFHYGVDSLTKGSCYINLTRSAKPSEEWLFTKVAQDVSMFITPMGKEQLYVEKINDFEFEVKSFSGEDVAFSYCLIGKRLDADTKDTRFKKSKLNFTLSNKGKKKLLGEMGKPSQLKQKDDRAKEIKKSLAKNHKRRTSVLARIKKGLSKRKKKI